MDECSASSMRTIDIIEGLTILQKYRTSQQGFDVGAEHDELFAYATDLPLSVDDLARMRELGWRQTNWGNNNRDYDVSEGWGCYV